MKVVSQGQDNCPYVESPDPGPRLETQIIKLTKLKLASYASTTYYLTLKAGILKM